MTYLYPSLERDQVLLYEDSSHSSSALSIQLLIYGTRSETSAIPPFCDMSHSNSRLFQPIRAGQIQLKHRVVLAPLTRARADEHHVPSLPMMKEYYSQRATTPGTLLITEATFIAPQAGGRKNAPGIYDDEQIDMWKEVCFHTICHQYCHR